MQRIKTILANKKFRVSLSLSVLALTVTVFVRFFIQHQQTALAEIVCSLAAPGYESQAEQIAPHLNRFDFIDLPIRHHCQLAKGDKVDLRAADDGSKHADAAVGIRSWSRKKPLLR